MRESPLHELSAADIARATNAGTLTAEAVVRSCLERIAQRESAVGAWAFLDADHAIAQARDIDKSGKPRPLRGVPVGVKDIIATADMPTTYGSPIYANHRPAWDAACVAAIREAGGIILGKTVTTEFASSHPGKTMHPRDPERTPGGSSSGSAAAVADRMVPLALATQTGGSVIRPASFCGVIGYKPSFGWINRHGVKPLSESFDTIGMMSRNIEDAALLASVLTGRSMMLEAGMIERPRIGVWQNNMLERAQSVTLSRVRDVMGLLSRGGAAIEFVQQPDEFAELDAAHHFVEYLEMGKSLLFEYRECPDRLSSALRKRIEEGRSYAPETYDRMQQVIEVCRQRMAAIFLKFDVVLFPSTLGEAPKGLWNTGNALFNRFWTALYVPIVNLPIGVGDNQMPLGIQLIGREGDDRRLLWLAQSLEAMLDGKAASS